MGCVVKSRFRFETRSHEPPPMTPHNPLGFFRHQPILAAARLLRRVGSSYQCSGCPDAARVLEHRRRALDATARRVVDSV
jgi:hypothetical protein